MLISIDASGQLRAWLNANEAGSITLATSASNNYNGQYAGIGFYGDEPSVNAMSRGDYTGYIDDVAIWDVSSDLTFAEILYSNGIGRTAIGDPVFTTDTISNLDGIELTPYTGQSLTDYADGIGTFSKESGPEWLLVSPNGTLSGIPKDTDVGQNTFTVRFENTSGDYDTATMTMNVVNVYSGVKGMEDLAGIASWWLSADCNDIPPCGGADLSGDNNVDTTDVVITAYNWLADEALLVYFQFEETSGDITRDDSIYSRSGSLINGSAWSTGISGGCLALDGINDYVEIQGFQGISCNAARTCCAWIKTGRTTTQEVISWGQADSSRKWAVGSAGNVLSIRVQGGNIFGSTVITDDAWYHIAVVWEPGLDDMLSNARLYVNGVEETISVLNDIVIDTGTDQNVCVGTFSGLNHFEGLIDEVRIYDRALSGPEIQSLLQ